MNAQQAAKKIGLGLEAVTAIPEKGEDIHNLVDKTSNDDSMRQTVNTSKASILQKKRNKT